MTAKASFTFAIIRLSAAVSLYRMAALKATLKTIFIIPALACQHDLSAFEDDGLCVGSTQSSLAYASAQKDNGRSKSKSLHDLQTWKCCNYHTAIGQLMAATLQGCRHDCRLNMQDNAPKVLSLLAATGLSDIC